MKVCIVGAGAIGGWIGARLAVAGHQVSVLARGATLAAIEANGLQLIEDGATHAVQVKASNTAAELETPDLLVIAVKGPGLRDARQRLSA